MIIEIEKLSDGPKLRVMRIKTQMAREPAIFGYAIFIIAFLLIGCLPSQPSRPVPQQPDLATRGWKVSEVPPDPPEFKREYVADLTNGRTLKLTAHELYFSSSSKVFWDGELDQPGDRYVLFDPKAVADRILDPQIVPAVQTLCDRIMADDAQWRASKPDHFTDASGVTWIRQGRTDR